MNAGDSVQKSMNAEETAVLQNIAALVQQALTMESAEENAPGQNGVEDAMNPGGVAKGAEQGRTPAEAQTVTDPNAPPKEKGMAPWDDNEEVKKAFQTIAKSIQTSDTEGTTGNDTADTRIEDVPEVTDENVKAVAKALMLAMGKKAVAKSQGAAPNVNAELLTVIKSLNAKVEAQGTVITEMLEGLGVAKAVDAATANGGVSTSVQKSGNRPYANLGDGNIVDVIAASVAKAMAATGSFQQSNSGIPVAKGFGNAYGHDDVRQFTEGFVETAGEKWGSHDIPKQ